MAALLPLSFNYAIKSPFSSPATWTFPNKDPLNELMVIRTFLGWGNTSAIVLVNQQPYESNFAWARAIVGTDVYIGTISAFSQGVPFSAAGINRIYINPYQKSLIIIPKHLYTDYEQIRANLTFDSFKVIELSK
jgi:hypothetical protein